jgi:hypothetical protein
MKVSNKLASLGMKHLVFVYKIITHTITLACTEVGGERFYSRLSASNWLQTVADAMSCALVVAQCVDRDG